MPRTVLNIGPLLIEESQTRAGKKVYRFFTRNATNSIGSKEHLKKIYRRLEKELVSTGALKPRHSRDRKYYWSKHKDINAKRRQKWAEKSEEINQKRRERYALLRGSRGV